MTTTELTWQDIPKKLRDKISVTARRGAKLLDKEMPGWHDEIDVGRLDMQQGCKCIYGQLRAEDVFLDKLQAVGKPGSENHHYFGYLLHPDVDHWMDDEEPRWSLRKAAWDWLKEEWLREIYTRREADRSALEGNKHE